MDNNIELQMFQKNIKVLNLKILVLMFHKVV